MNLRRSITNYWGLRYVDDGCIEGETEHRLGYNEVEPVRQPVDEPSKSAFERVPNDLFVVLSLLIAVLIALIWPVADIVRSALVGVFLLFLPGYTFTTAAFPSGGSQGLDGVERLALSFGLSLAGVPMLFIAVQPTDGLTASYVVNLVTVPVVVFLLIGAVRRFYLPPNERYDIDIGGFVTRRLDGLDGSANLDAFLSVVLVASIVLALGGLGYAVAAPQEPAATTSVSILTQNGTNYTQDEYPAQPTVGASNTLTLRVKNEEGRSVQYTVLVTLDSVTSNGTVTQRTEIDRFQREIEAGDVWNRTHSFTARSAQPNRLTYFVYIENAPENPTRNSAYRVVYLWLDVDAPNTSNG